MSEFDGKGDSDEIPVCPECGVGSVYQRKQSNDGQSRGPRRGDPTARWTCKRCGERLDEVEWREPKEMSHAAISERDCDRIQQAREAGHSYPEIREALGIDVHVSTIGRHARDECVHENATGESGHNGIGKLLTDPEVTTVEQAQEVIADHFDQGGSA